MEKQVISQNQIQTKLNIFLNLEQTFSNFLSEEVYENQADINDFLNLLFQQTINSTEKQKEEIQNEISHWQEEDIKKFNTLLLKLNQNNKSKTITTKSNNGILSTIMKSLILFLQMQSIENKIQITQNDDCYFVALKRLNIENSEHINKIGDACKKIVTT